MNCLCVCLVHKSSERRTCKRNIRNGFTNLFPSGFHLASGCEGKETDNALQITWIRIRYRFMLVIRFGSVVPSAYILYNNITEILENVWEDGEQRLHLKQPPLIYSIWIMLSVCLPYSLVKFNRTTYGDLRGYKRAFQIKNETTQSRRLILLL